MTTMSAAIDLSTQVRIASRLLRITPMVSTIRHTPAARAPMTMPVRPGARMRLSAAMRHSMGKNRREIGIRPRAAIWATSGAASKAPIMTRARPP